MKIFLESAAALVFTFLIGISLNAEALNSLEMVEDYALANNIEYKTAALEAVKAYNDLEYFFTLDESELNLSGSYSSGTDETVLGAAVSLPLFEQLSLSVSADEDLEGSLGFSFSPLSHSDSLEQSRLGYTLALASAENVAEEVRLEAVENYLSWSSAAKALEVAEKTADVMKIIYDDEKIRMENGEAVLDDVRDAFIDWTDARSTYNTTVTTLQQAETDLYSTLNADSETIVILPPESEEIQAAVTELVGTIDTGALSIYGKWEVISAGIETESLETELDSTWFFEPDLSIGGAVDFSTSSSPGFSTTISLRAGLDDFNGSDIEELRTEVGISREIEAQKASEQQLMLNQCLTAAETAGLDYQKTQTELEQAEELYLEAEFLFELGEYSAAELEETRLLLESSKNSLFSAAAAQYTALQALATFMP